VTKDRVFWSKAHESHEEIIREYGLHADGARGPNIVRVEISPEASDFTLPLDQWAFRLDQDDRPKWYDAAEVKRRVRESLPEWMAAKVVLPGQTRKSVKDGEVVVATYGTVQSVEGGTVQYVKGGTVQYVEGGTVQSVEGGTVQYVEGGTVQYVRGGTVQSVRGGTVTYYITPDLSILRSPNAVLIDRSSGRPVCHVGKEAAE